MFSECIGTENLHHLPFNAIRQIHGGVYVGFGGSR